MKYNKDVLLIDFIGNDLLSRDLFQKKLIDEQVEKETVVGSKLKKLSKFLFFLEDKLDRFGVDLEDSKKMDRIVTQKLNAGLTAFMLVEDQMNLERKFLKLERQYQEFINFEQKSLKSNTIKLRKFATMHCLWKLTNNSQSCSKIKKIK